MSPATWRYTRPGRILRTLYPGLLSPMEMASMGSMPPFFMIDCSMATDGPAFAAPADHEAVVAPHEDDTGGSIDEEGTISIGHR